MSGIDTKSFKTVEDIKKLAFACQICGESAVFEKNKEICAMCALENHEVKETPKEPEVDTPDMAKDRAAGFPPVICSGPCGQYIRGKWKWCQECKNLIKKTSQFNVCFTHVFGPVHISNQEGANDKTLLEAHGIKQMYTIGKVDDVVVAVHEGILQYRYSIDDNHLAKIRPVFEDAFAMIERNGNSLIHCKAGASRSASVVIAYLMWLGLSYRVAYGYLFWIRPILNINAGFHQELMAYERELSSLKVIN